MGYGRLSRASRFFSCLAAFERHQQQQRNRHRRCASTDVPSFSSVVNRENLLRVFKSLKAKGGQAPGVDGLRYTDVSTAEIGEVLQQVSISIHADDYQPQPIRSVRIPKPRGGHRNLKLMSIVDRVIATAVAEAIGPKLDERFKVCSCSYGYRKWLSTWHMLAKIEWLATERGQTAIAIDDIRQAFDFVPIEPLMELVRRRIADPCQ
jgi:RNA-directed DNA polymerase